MKFILASSFVPFINGGARFIVEWLEDALRDRGHEVERFYLPFVDTPHDLLDQIAAFRMIDLSNDCDRLIAFRPPAYAIRHPHKILWFIHHIRTFYDLWGGEYGPPKTPEMIALRQALMNFDNHCLREARAVFTNSDVVKNRLQEFNGLAAETLYPPLQNPGRFRRKSYGDEIVVVSRVEPHKRQSLLIEAMAYVTTPVRLRLCGRSSSEDYGRRLQAAIDATGAGHRIVFEDRWISEEEKADLLADALAVAYLPQDEDSYGYPSLEAAHAGKAVLTTVDSGGVLELIADRVNGLVCEPSPRALAAAMDELYRDRGLATRLGAEAEARLKSLRIDWDHVVQAVTR